jgi:hypothetical protein
VLPKSEFTFPLCPAKGSGTRSAHGAKRQGMRHYILRLSRMNQRMNRGLRQSVGRLWLVSFALPLFGLAFLENAAFGEMIRLPEPADGASASSIVRVERLPIAGGAELVTLIGKVQVSPESRVGIGPAEIPLVSILRDSLGDDDPTNDRLRDVWMLTYTRPTLTQQVTAAVPFFYSRFGNKEDSGESVPPPMTDLVKKGANLRNRFS